MSAVPQFVDRSRNLGDYNAFTRIGGVLPRDIQSFINRNAFSPDTGQSNVLYLAGEASACGNSLISM